MLGRLRRGPFRRPNLKQRAAPDIAPFATLTAATGTFVETGNAAPLTLSLKAATGAFAVTGLPLQEYIPDAIRPNLRRRGPFRGPKLKRLRTSAPAVAPAASVTTTLTAATGTFVETGNAALFQVQQATIRQTYATTGITALFQVQHHALTQAYTETGNAALFQVQQHAATRAYTETGSAALFRLSLAAAVRAYTLAGLAAPLTVILRTTTAGYVLSGNAALLSQATRLLAGTGGFALTGNPSTGTLLLLAPVFGTYRGSGGAKPAPAETPTGDWNDISNSSHLSRFQYAADSNRLSIEFNNGSAYTYQGVPSHVVDGLRSTSTPGQYFHSMIRSQYKSSKG